MPPWSHPHPHPPVLPIDLDEWYLPTEIAHGVLPAWLTFALLEQARWARTRRDAPRTVATAGRDDGTGSATVAADNPDAWFRTPRTADEIMTPTADNRMVALPYTKRMTAFMDVDMAAANLLVTRAVADEWGVPEDRRVYLRGWGFARDAIHLGARADLTVVAGDARRHDRGPAHGRGRRRPGRRVRPVQLLRLRGAVRPGRARPLARRSATRSR